MNTFKGQHKDEYQKLKDNQLLFDFFIKIMDKISKPKNHMHKFKLDNFNKDLINLFLIDNVIDEDGKGSYTLTGKGGEFSRFYLEERISKHKDIENI